jgi:hypothetical protein
MKGKAGSLVRKLAWVKRFHDAGAVPGSALMAFLRELYDCGDDRGLQALRKGLGWRLTDKEIVDVCQRRARIEGDSLVGFRVVPNEQN